MSLEGQTRQIAAGTHSKCIIAAQLKLKKDKPEIFL